MAPQAPPGAPQREDNVGTTTMRLGWTKQVTSPKAWRGDALAKDTAWIVTFTDAELADIDRAVKHASATGKPLEEIGRAEFPLTVARKKLEDAVTEMYDGRGFVVLRGLPVTQ